MQPFQAIICNKTESAYTATIETVGEEALVSTGDQDVLVKVDYSTINFKDGLAITGRSPILRKFPMSPVLTSASSPTVSMVAVYADSVLLQIIA